MLTFKTQFPIQPNCSISDFLVCAHHWVTGSPHGALKRILPPALSDGGSYAYGDETLSCMTYENEDHQSAGVRYEMLDENNIRWTTNFVGHRKKSSPYFMVAVELGVDSELPVEHLDQGRRPYVIKTALQQLGGGNDGPLQVSDKPISITDKDINLVADLICGRAGLQMPIVYVSVDNNDKTHIDAPQLATWLSGMAHVIIEPSRSFSFRLMNSVYGENAYDGAVAIYWPDGIGKWLFLPTGRLCNPKDMQIAISRKIRSSLLSQRTVRECTWSYLRDVRARQRIEELKASGSQNIEEYVEQFDAELKAKEIEIQRLEAELSRLTYSQNFGIQRDINEESSITISTHENDLYQAERLDIIMEVLRTACSGVEKYSRRELILSDILKSNTSSGEREIILDRLKDALRQYNSMDTKTRKTFESLGFEISDDGKHYKLLFRGDTRYPFTLSKTVSDRRSGMNAFTDLKKLLF